MNPDSPRRAYYHHDQDPPGERWCPRCEQVKPLAEFTLPSGVRGHCRPCRLAVNQEWRARHHDELLARRRATYRPTRRRRWLKPLSIEGETR